MKIHAELQGSQEWLALRLAHLCASEASAMMGMSKFLTRSELLRQKHTGIAVEVDEATQRRFDAGNLAEENARPLIEAQIGEELYQVTCTREVEGLPLLASLDGLNMAGDTAWECKLFNNGLAYAIERKEIEPHYWAQLEQQLLVSGASRVRFTTATTEGNNMVGMWYESVPERRAQIIAGWKQFADDLANYRPAESVAESVAAPVMSLPAIAYRLNGLALTSNLDEYRAAAERLVENSKKLLETDQDFANQDAMNKAFKEAEERIAVVCEQVISEIKDVDAFTRELSHVGELIRQARLNGEKQVKARKESIRVEIQNGAKATLADYINAKNALIGKPYMPAISGNFAAAMSGKKTIDSLRNAANTELAACKIQVNEIADRIQVNLNSLRELATDHAFLFFDTAQIVQKQNDDLVALIKTRIADHKEAEAKKAEDARLKKEQEGARAAAALSMQTGVDVPAAAAAITASAAPFNVPQATTRPVSPRPTDDLIIGVLERHYHVHGSVVIGWLIDMDLLAAVERWTDEMTLAGSRK